MKKFLREPIVHFIALGGLLVLIHNLWSNWQGELGRTIVVSETEIARLSTAWSSSSGREATQKDRNYIIDQYVKEEILVREAGRLGLDGDDVIIRRRMAQKMDFLITSKTKTDAPSDAVLRKFYEENISAFSTNERRSFNHIYLSPEKHGDAIDRQASEVLTALNAGGNWQELGDPFIQKRSYAVVPKVEVTRLFGEQFSDAVFALPAGQWSKPIGSAFGLHIVKIETVDTALQADFEPVKNEVLEAWKADQQLQQKAEQIDDLVSGYKIIVEGQK